MVANVISTICLVTLLTASAQSAGLIGTVNFKLTKIEPCDSSEYQITVKPSFRNGDNGMQYLTAENDFKVNFGEDSDYNVTVQMKKTKSEQNFSPLFTLYDENACDALKKYLGEFILEAEKAAGIEPGLCPVPKGNYPLKDFPMDFSKIAFQSVPEGVLLAKHTMTNTKTKEVLMCLIAEIENFSK